MRLRAHCNAATLLAAFCLAGPAAAQAPVRETPAVKPSAGAPALFANIGDRPAIVYDTPQVKTAAKTFIFGAHHAVEILVKLANMVKVRDADGSVGWVEPGVLGGARFVEALAPSAEIRAQPAADAVLVFEAAKGVLLEVAGAASEGWLPVKHRDGQSGYVKATQVFGE